MKKKLLLFGLIAVVLGIILGAFGAHALQKIATPKELNAYETAIKYLMYNGLLCVALSAQDEQIFLKWKNGFNLLIAGVLMFVGSLFVLSLRSQLPFQTSFIGPITPIGGTLMIIGWSWLVKNVLNK